MARRDLDRKHNTSARLARDEVEAGWRHVLREMGADLPLAEWARRIGTSPMTLARVFDEYGLERHPRNGRGWLRRKGLAL